MIVVVVFVFVRLIIISGGREPEGAGPSPLKLCPTAICVRQKIDSFLPNVSIFMSLSMFKSISLSLPVYFCLFFFLSFFNFFSLHIFSFPTHFFFFSLSFVICFVSDTILCPTPGPSREGPEGPPDTPLAMKDVKVKS